MAADLEAMATAELIRCLAEVEDALRAFQPTLVQDSDHLSVNPNLIHLAEREQAISAELAHRRQGAVRELRRRPQSIRPLA